MEELIKLIESEGCYFISGNRDSVKPLKLIYPFRYFYRRNGFMNKLSAPLDYLVNTFTARENYWDFAVFFPHELVSCESFVLSDKEYMQSLENVRMCVPIARAIRELKIQRKSFQLIDVPEEVMGYPIKPVKGLPYDTSVHAERSYDIFCQHMNRSDIRFLGNCVVREGFCDLCSREKELAKSEELLYCIIEFVRAWRSLGKEVEKYNLACLIDEHNELTKDLEVLGGL